LVLVEAAFSERFGAQKQKNKIPTRLAPFRPKRRSELSRIANQFDFARRLIGFIACGFRASALAANAMDRLAWPLLKDKREPGSHSLKYKSHVTFLWLSQRDLKRSRFFFADRPRAVTLR
jgi:hypothetical protein